MKKILNNILLAAIIMIAGCAKDGAVGPSGSNGTNGTNGNANVQSMMITALPSTWQNFGTFGHNDISVPQITQAILDSGIISSYWIYNTTTGTQIPLPFVDGNTQFSYYPQLTVGHYKLEIDHFGSTFTNPTSTMQIKLVLATAHARMSNPDLNWNDYESVKTRFHLAE